MPWLQIKLWWILESSITVSYIVLRVFLQAGTINLSVKMVQFLQAAFTGLVLSAVRGWVGMMNGNCKDKGSVVVIDFQNYSCALQICRSAWITKCSC